MAANGALENSPLTKAFGSAAVNRLVNLTFSWDCWRPARSAARLRPSCCGSIAECSEGRVPFGYIYGE
jgi:hypothetical protein